MYQKLNSISFYTSFLSVFGFTYAFYSCVHYNFISTTQSYTLFSLAILTLFILGLLSFRDKTSLFAKVKSWLTMIFTGLLVVLLVLIHLASHIGGKELLQSTTSPDEAYTVNLYSWNAGAAGTFGVVGEIEGLLFDKRFYQERRTEEAQAEWINPHTIVINHHKVDLAKRETYFN